MLALFKVNTLVGSALFVVLVSLYMLTYSGRPGSTDELRILDGVTSLYHYGDWEQDETLYLSIPTILTTTPFPTNTLPADERVASVYALPLYALAQVVPALGITHTVWLLNVLLLAWCGVGVFLLARRIGYSPHVAVLAGLLCGVATIVWPYSKTLYRDPMLMTFMVYAALFLLIARTSFHPTRWLWLTVGLVFVAASAVTKDSALFAVPALLIWIWPATLVPSVSWGRSIALVLITTPFAALLIYVLFPALHAPIISLGGSVLQSLSSSLRFADEAIYTYLISPTVSVWATSPVLLLAVPGIWVLWRCGQLRLIWAVAWLVAGFVSGHAAFADIHWYGGLSYPPRFMVPVIPFMLLLTLPVIDSALRRYRWWLMLPVIALVTVSVWIQYVNAVSFNTAYSGLLPAESGGLIEWTPALQHIEFSRWALLPQSWSEIGLDVASWRAPLELWVGGLSVTLLTGLILIYAGLKGVGGRRLGIGCVSVAVTLFATTSGFLITLNRSDPTTFSTSDGLRRAFEILDEHASSGELLLMPFSSFQPYVFNTQRSSDLRPFTLLIPNRTELQPGEQVTDFNPLNSVNGRLPQVMAHFAANYDRVWFLTNSTPFQANAPRADEYFLSTRYYLLREHSTGDIDVRLLEYVLEAEPQPLAGQHPDILTDLEFAARIRLNGAVLPRGTQYAAGDAVPVEIHWQAVTSLNRDYVIAMYLADANGAVVAQGGDGAASGGLWPGTRWSPGRTVTDRRALMVPESLPVGEYRLWLVVYEFIDGQVVRLPLSAGATNDPTIAELPLTIYIK